MSDHQTAATLATATLMTIISNGQAYQAAVLRGDVEQANAIRQRAHDLMDAYMDRNGEAAQAVRAILES